MTITGTWKRLCLFTTFASVSLLISGCGSRTDQGHIDELEGRTAPGATSGFTIKGSDTMVHLVIAWAEDFMKRHPETTISVTGGGSGTGIAALLNGTTEVCASSRDVKEEEIQRARQNGMELTITPVARDAITVIVNPANTVSELTLEQIKKIYTGAYKTWDQVGGPVEPIVVVSRESSSGTFMYFLEHVLNKEDYSQDAQLLPATSAVIQSVKDSPWAIGYVGLGYAEGAADSVKMIAVKSDMASPAVAPSSESVLSGEYSIARPLLLVNAGTPAGTVKDFLEYCVSAEGQVVVEETGYVKVD
jgi:phosphate transport system substrate-binding protein